MKQNRPPTFEGSVKVNLAMLVFFVFLLACNKKDPSSSGSGTPIPDPVIPSQNTKPYQLVWSDEFNKDGLPDTAQWSYDVGGSGWGNNELEYYTDKRSENARA